MLNHMLFMIFAMLQIADIYTTYRVVNTKIGREANNLMEWLIQRVGLLPALIGAKFTMLVCVWFFILPMRIAAPSLCFFIVIYSLVIINNISVIRRG